ncbi:hypothetical protein CIY_20060 [Butyrivibrio fibrisolvens 16/4]|nr:hypothetical protein CIY_20060 [Butyrivibrio fibrisolvens 16/4]
MIWLLMFVGAALGAVLGSIYLINSIAKFSFIKIDLFHLYWF